MKSYFFFSVETGELLGKFVLPRDQGADEACTIHNYNVVPLRNKGGKPRYVLVSGNYMSGISVVDFTDPGDAREIAYADPPAFPDGFEGGDWSTYWYNGRIYESDLVWGLLTWRLDDPRGDHATSGRPTRTRRRRSSRSTDTPEESAVGSGRREAAAPSLPPRRETVHTPGVRQLHGRGR